MILQQSLMFNYLLMLLCKLLLNVIDLYNRIRHPKEKISKSSIVASKLVAQDKVEIKHEMFVSSLRQEDEDYDSVVLLFPTEDAIEVTKMS